MFKGLCEPCLFGVWDKLMCTAVFIFDNLFMFGGLVAFDGLAILALAASAA